ncbi:UDP-N-acetyl-D-galactosamine dehydrogenase [Parabacteroides sp. PF5-5]|uniref:nucleotide sugar dehydrogenase n=1 Tax=unclassified Parabacteroides TaxID=2649774 RepID=UPI0024769B99|nr:MULTISPECIES: nucleotide sugar dehydrogenase [unclassified Parabacteroides]MDH6305378.1 UDP-N-acetyl-D-galactosamine dehydrogenase [Parabacteroides sp. PH5-39]MDH6316088.1 UDP-N-acetyl-D-galactosamine dehydrogenase [Parabacteroides sp. PF5-13]MDH6320238.1 UDP-N-acetyl-D-galactosamine dehydrogenase [Parabacteroides sp. PH5-13]MDH6323968.1 UDP-N-acetyl-D-galactosamine dehydrogenase [Parabacteroides sp. PH5-8]MDH6327279.1 UDP-N-acetyl-D-galactosamine dehydrogenase [Parabacteroides sp. PH5-41]
MDADTKIAIIGLGYVGLPLAIEFGKKYKTLGFDISEERVQELCEGKDHTKEADISNLQQILHLRAKDPEQGLAFSCNEDELKEYTVFVVTVPTPIDRFNTPDISYLVKASESVGRVIKKGDIVIYESTTYPGCTEEDCIPVIEKISGLRFNKDFFAGYSPERINPGDKVNTLTRIRKVTSGSTPEVADRIDALYNSIIEAGTYKAASIRVAEASKIIENVQRDVNISLVNELALIFDRMGIDTNDVLEAAGSKWNFLKYRPGLVGGHCISVDPYYLANKAESLGYVPQVILSGRRVNNSIAPFIANKVMKLMIEQDHTIKGAHALILGVSFKENCPDFRNTKVIDIYRELCEFGMHVDLYDPWVSAEDIRSTYQVDMLEKIDPNKRYEAIILAVSHDEFQAFDFQEYHKQGCVIFDTKAVIDRDLVDGRL